MTFNFVFIDPRVTNPNIRDWNGECNGSRGSRDTVYND